MNAAGKLKNWFQDQKDTSVSFLVEKMLQKKLERYGQLLEFKLDSRRCAAFLSLRLKGESAPVSVRIEEYQVLNAAGTGAVVVKRASASREWLTLLLEDVVLGKPFTIPEKYASITRMLL